MSSAVLVVADDEPVRHFIEMVLRHEFNVESVGTAVDATERLAKERFDALVLDSTDAFAVLRYVQSAEPSLIGKTVLATSRPRDAANAELREIGRVILKPFDARRLLDAVTDCLSPA